MTIDWQRVSARLLEISARPGVVLDDGQRRTIRWMAGRVVTKGIVLADEVGTGKTRIACALVEAVIACGGRAAVVVPPGLMHQWSDEWKELRPDSAVEPKRLITFTSYVRSIVEASERQGSLDAAIAQRFPERHSPEVWLISHGLRAPVVRMRGDEYRRAPWKLALPSLVQAEVANASVASDRRTRVGWLRRAVEDRAEARNGDALVVVQRIAEVVASDRRTRRTLARELADLPVMRMRPGADNRELAEAYRKDGAAQRAFESLLGRFLGEFDLIVIDEAHKSRGADDGEEGVEPRRGPVLTNLIERILAASADSRRLGITATPLELQAEQWHGLLKRALRGPLSYDVAGEAAAGTEAARILESEAARIRRALAEGSDAQLSVHDLDRLCAAATSMTSTLRPHVTRRRKTDDLLHTRFQDAVRVLEDPRFAGIAASSRPHRRVSMVTIDTLSATPERATATSTDPTSAVWTRALFAMECLAESLRGYARRVTDAGSDSSGTASHWLRTAYTRVSGGHLPENYAGELSAFLKRLPEAGDDPIRRRHRDRIEYWVREEQRALDALAGTGAAATHTAADPLWAHPRVRKAVDVIEGYTQRGEKVLVFGTFRAPMRALANVLEVRHALHRLMTDEPIVAVAPTGRVPLAWLELERMRGGGEDPKRVCGADRSALEARWTAAHRRYGKFHEQTKRRVQAATPALLERRGIPAGELGAVNLLKLADIATPFVLDRLLYATSAHASSEQASLDAALDELWNAYFAAAIEARRAHAENDDGDDDASVLVAVLDALGEQAAKAHDTHHVRELHGGTDHGTRELLQAKFNRRYAAPHVLVAQSRVGREGLNLHESCSVVVQFNAEWNPGILEQQIGRVDRKNSLWQDRATKWLADPKASGDGAPPFIEVHQIVFAGTYDHFQWEAVHARQHLFDATLYGELLPAAKLANLDQTRRDALARSAPDFRPPPESSTEDVGR